MHAPPPYRDREDDPELKHSSSHRNGDPFTRQVVPVAVLLIFPPLAGGHSVNHEIRTMKNHGVEHKPISEIQTRSEIEETDQLAPAAEQPLRVHLQVDTGQTYEIRLCEAFPDATLILLYPPFPRPPHAGTRGSCRCGNNLGSPPPHTLQVHQRGIFQEGNQHWRRPWLDVDHLRCQPRRYQPSHALRAPTATARLTLAPFPMPKLLLLCPWHHPDGSSLPDHKADSPCQSGSPSSATKNNGSTGRSSVWRNRSQTSRLKYGLCFEQ